MKPNIVFVLLDGARCDRIGISQDFTELSRKGTLLNNVSTTIPYTFGSLNTIFTGKYGKENGVDGYYKMMKLKESIDFLPEVLKNNGYFTSRGLISDKILSSRGFDIREVFDEFEDDLNTKHPEFIENTFLKSKNKPFFIFLQYTKIHAVTVTEVLKKFEWDDKNFYNNKSENLKTYDSVFKETGIYAKKIQKTLERLNILDNTIVIFFSDHGTGIGERFGERNYGSFTYEETIRTFYLFIGNKIKEKKISNSLLSTIDIFPTILDLCGIKTNEKFVGNSFANFLKNDEKIPDRKFTFSETGGLHGPYPSPEKSNVFCIKSLEYKLVYLKDQDEWKFYDLKNDPDEIENIIDNESEIQDHMKKNLLEWLNR